LGQYAGEVDLVTNVYVNNVTMANAENGARIKAFGGNASPTSTSGGGSGLVRNITFANMIMLNVDAPIVIDQCYETSDSTCVQYPSRVTIEDVHYVNITGTGVKSAKVVSLVCSDVCQDITATGTKLLGTKGEAEYICQNVASTAQLDFPCNAAGVFVSATRTWTSTSTTKPSKTATKTSKTTKTKASTSATSL
jgi:galacturan 1,4-alpha-galacturonidase